ncbi:MAG: tetraacyldisaccharide 4'-kinase [Gammaproteobacteria bacterium]|nr:tetraacyldisaccharide 4'-kinase [Gammaproteobacteria bacterium]
MNKKLSVFLNEIWYQWRFPWIMALLWPFSFFYGGLFFVWRLRYRYFYKKPVLKLPIIVIGNLTVGGTGKTPLTLGLLAFLKNKNLKVGVISRGYKSKAEYAEAPVIIEDQHRAVDVGDEALLIFKETQAPVAVHHQRMRAVEALLIAHPDLDLILSDDGLQHLKLPRAMEVVVVDGQRQFGNGYLLPAGPLREPLSRLKEVDFVVQSGVDFKLESFNLLPLNSANEKKSLDFVRGKTIHAVAGIGNPARFFASLEALGAEVICHSFPDHHAFVQADFSDFQNECIVMTAKDAVKCLNFILPQACYLNTKIIFSPLFRDAFWQKLCYIMRLELPYGSKDE